MNTRLFTLTGQYEGFTEKDEVLSEENQDEEKKEEPKIFKYLRAFGNNLELWGKFSQGVPFCGDAFFFW